MRYVIIAAMCKTRGIGSKGALPWRIPQDFHHFSTVTRGNGNNAIVMGRTTWEGLPNKPLDGRDNIVLTTQTDYDIHAGATSNKRVFSFTTVEEIHKHCVKQQYDTVWICGGEQVYRTYLELNMVSQCVITFIDAEYQCDTFFPDLGDNWEQRQEQQLTWPPYGGCPRATVRYLCPTD